MAKQKDVWDEFSSPDLAPGRFDSPAHPLVFPLNVGTTRFANSMVEKPLQLCDVLAGATRERLQALASGKSTEFADALGEAGIEKMIIGTMWPSREVTPDALGRKGVDGNIALEHIAEQLAKRRGRS